MLSQDIRSCPKSLGAITGQVQTKMAGQLQDTSVPGQVGPRPELRLKSSIRRRLSRRARYRDEQVGMAIRLYLSQWCISFFLEREGPCSCDVFKYMDLGKCSTLKELFFLGER